MLMPLKDARARAEQVWPAREMGGQSWSRIASQYGYTSVGGAQRAYTRYCERNPAVDAKVVLAGIQLATRNAVCAGCGGNQVCCSRKFDTEISLDFS